MPLEIKRLHLAKLSPPGGERGQWPVHGFVITHPGGAVLVDTGVDGPDDLLSDWRVVNVSAADALAALDMSPADISLVLEFSATTAGRPLPSRPAAPPSGRVIGRGSGR